MRLVVPSATLTTAFAAAQTFLSSSAAATAVGWAYEFEAQHQDINSSASAEECFVAKKTYLRESAADAGILQACSEPGYICVEDATSSLGGICILDEVVERELQTTCTKCTPASACTGLTATFIANNIGEGSCCGENACVGVSSNTKIGANSCIGNKNCYFLKDATIGDRSCLYDSIKGAQNSYGYACAYLQGKVGNDSCHEYAACYQYGDDNKTFNIGNNACQGHSSCMYSYDVTISNGSCIGYFTCWTNKGNIGLNSCIGRQACEENQALIGDCKCLGDYICENNVVALPGSSCTSVRKLLVTILLKLQYLTSTRYKAQLTNNPFPEFYFLP
eukprot:CCRYP_008330-RE/>CCRYP_008330-RE protein AED:0.26 eAED:0.26 QI:86/1/1/1/0.94/0.84/19/688/333